jgi:hypothetical protein
MLVQVPHQNSPTILPAIKATGCNFIAVLYLAARHDWKDYNVRDVNQLYWRAVNGGMMRKNCLVVDAAKLFTHLTGDECTFRFEKPEYKCVETPDWVEYEILHYQSERYGAHFLPGDSKGNIEWDPWEGGSLITKDPEKKLVKKNIFRVTK